MVGSAEVTMPTDGNLSPSPRKVRRNKGRLTGQKRPLKPKDVWAVRVRLQLQRRKRDLALFNLAIDSKLRGCDLVRLRLNEFASAATGFQAPSLASDNISSPAGCGSSRTEGGAGG